MKVIAVSLIGAVFAASSSPASVEAVDEVDEQPEMMEQAIKRPKLPTAEEDRIDMCRFLIDAVSRSSDLAFKNKSKMIREIRRILPTIADGTDSPQDKSWLHLIAKTVQWDFRRRRILAVDRLRDLFVIDYRGETFSLLNDEERSAVDSLTSLPKLSNEAMLEAIEYLEKQVDSSYRAGSLSRLIEDQESPISYYGCVSGLFRARNLLKQEIGGERRERLELADALEQATHDENFDEAKLLIDRLSEIRRT